MKIKTEYINSVGSINNTSFPISRLAFIKHMGIAGQGYAPKLNKLDRILGKFFSFRNYIRKTDFDNHNRFSQPPIRFSDPTEKAQFSNIAGKSIADYLSKKINKSILTVNYEAAMRIKNFPIKGSRPDLIAFTNSKIFAIEAKGYNRSSSGNMNAHKKQSKSGPLNVNFTIASVSYNLYNDVKCKYHDPINPEIDYDNELLRDLSKQYYSGIFEYFNESYFERTEFEANGEQFYEIDLFTRKFVNSLGFDLFPSVFPKIEFLFFNSLRPKLIVPKNIQELAENGISQETEPFIMEQTQMSYLYIDTDRIGLKIL